MNPRSNAPGLRAVAVVALGLITLSGCFSGGGPVSGVAPGTGPSVGTGPLAGGTLDPRGNDAMFTFSWWINGQDPRTTGAADPCHFAGVEYIRMGVTNPNDSTQTFEPFQWDCHLGTHTSSQPEVRSGAFDVYWEAVRADGSIISIAPAQVDARGNVVPAPEMANFVSGQTYNFDLGNTATPGDSGHPTNFSTGSGPLSVALSYLPGVPAGSDGGVMGRPGDTDASVLSGDGGADGGTGVGLSCASAGVATVTWRLLASNGVAIEDHSTREDCTRYSSIQWTQVDWDDYSLEVTARDQTGNVVVQGLCANLLAGPGATSMSYHCTVQPAM